MFLLRGLVDCVSGGTLLAAYHALFHSVMTYAIAVWGGASSADRVFALQRRAIRILARLGFREDCRNAFHQLGILTFPAVFIMENLIFVKKNESSFTTHGDVHDHRTRARQNIVSTYCRLAKCQSRPDFMAVKLFNKLPVPVRILEHRYFRKRLKLFFTRNVFYSVNEFLNFDMSRYNFNA